MPTPSGVPVAMMSPGFERQALRQPLDNVATGKIMSAVEASCLLTPFTRQLHPLVLRIAELVGGDDAPVPSGRKPSRLLPLNHWPCRCWRSRARDVVDHGVAEDVGERLGACAMFRPRADDDPQLHLPVELRW